jgi:hypothetical protein
MCSFYGAFYDFRFSYKILLLPEKFDQDIDMVNNVWKMFVW